ncbi:uncharacterized protein LOC120076256 [Benincasa hispida]|uniref:uncharacterized protein LOC120076256 n=1 Tax=Benincasa hispida TaxID=102211 RepID=UPI001900631E|nr:uncharacterized protein LOC120076256 [Benincasa hispida]
MAHAGNLRGDLPVQDPVFLVANHNISMREYVVLDLYNFSLGIAKQVVKGNDILANKRKIGENETVALTYECSALFQNDLPAKMKDPGTFTLPCTIRGKMLADRSIKLPEDKIEDVLVQVDKFIFPADFILLDYEADREIPLILGSPFLATGRAFIDVQKGELTIRVDDQEVKFNVLNALKYPGDIENCQYIEEL